MNPSGKCSTVFNRSASPEQVKRDLPCGQCVGCRLERSRQWAIRCVHEASLYKQNCFITLTFDDVHLPKGSEMCLRCVTPHVIGGSLCVSTFQDFMKRLRKEVGNGVRFFHCGEYGDRLGRPHYHALLFNFDFADRELFTTRGGNRLFTSKSLGQLWPFGFSLIGDVTFDSAAYCARYVMKKVTGVKAKEHYGDLRPEYVTMSRGSGIGAKWFESFRSDVYPSDEVIINGKSVRPPRFYDGLLDATDPELLESIKCIRVAKSKFNSDERLLVKEQVKLASIKSLNRNLEVF